MADNWFDNSAQVRSFQQALMDAGVLETPAEIRSFLEKPWNFNDEFDAWTENGSPNEDDDSWQDFIDAISDDETPEPETTES